MTKHQEKFENLSHIADVLPYAIKHPKLSFFGIAFVHAWYSWINVNGYGSVQGFWPLATNGVVACALLLIALVYLKKPDKNIRSGGTVLVALVLAAATLCLAYTDSTLLHAAGVVLSGAGVAWLYVLWGQFYSHIHLKNAFVCIFVAYILSSLIKIALLFIPETVSPIILATFPLLTTWCLLKSGQQESILSKERSTIYLRLGSMSPVWKFALCVAVYTTILAAIRLMPFPEKTVPLMVICHVSEIALALIILVYMLFRGKPVRIAPLWSVLLFFVATALLLIGVDRLEASLLFMDLGTSFIIILSWTVFADFSRHSSLHPFVVFSIGRLAYSLPGYLVFIFVRFFDFSSNALALSMALFWTLSLATVYFLSAKELSSMEFFNDLSAKTDGGLSVSEIEARCREIANQYGLTDREAEIMALLCLGKSKAFIGGQLFLSESTVKTHTRNLYAKLEIHNKNELQELIGL